MPSSLSGSKPSVPERRGNRTPKGFSAGRINQLTPEQWQQFHEMSQRLGPDSWLSKLAMGDEGEFGQLETPALKQFSELQGGLASRFSGMGQGARGSSGFKNSSNQAATDFAQQLQSQRLNLRSQAMKDLMGYSNEFLNQRPYEQFLTENKQKQGAGWGGVLSSAGAGAAAGSSAGPWGALAGGAVGAGVGLLNK